MELERIICPLCQHPSSRPLFVHAEEQHVRCAGCGLIYVNPRQPRQEIESFYEEEYYALGQKIDYDARVGFFAGVAARIEALVPPGRLLDIGCGYGQFLLACRQRGWQVAGVELGGPACVRARAQGLEVFHGTLTQAGYAENSFDVVTLWNVLDHLVDPLGEVRQVLRVLRPGGLIYFRVPNAAFHLRAKRVLRLLAYLGVRDVTTFHLISLNAGTARRLLETAGFGAVRVENSPLSAVNPWSAQRAHRARLISLLKGGVQLGVAAGALLSGGRWLWAPAIEVQGRKEGRA
ncbi:MAG: class I SAM-dependent methyltransferase [Candidatus Latescibacteria bacterium]|nr:class I SAM-dependent methyltransferase [Candidatus Latescibacterota bacterium]